MNEITYLRKCSEVFSYNAGIIELSLLKNGMPKKYHNYFNTTLDLLSWLFQDFNYFTIDPVAFINALCYDSINKVYHSENLLKVTQKLEKEKDEGDDYLPDNDLDYIYNDDTHIGMNPHNFIIYSITLDDIKSVCKNLLLLSIELEKQSHSDINSYNNYEEAKFNFDIMEQIHDYFTDMLRLADVDLDVPNSIADLNILNMNQRWILYFHWVRTTQNMFGPKIVNLEQIYMNISKQYSELKELENIEILNRMHVVALTTTGAAKHRIMLEGLESPIGINKNFFDILNHF